MQCVQSSMLRPSKFTCRHFSLQWGGIREGAFRKSLVRRHHEDTLMGIGLVLVTSPRAVTTYLTKET